MAVAAAVFATVFVALAVIAFKYDYDTLVPLLESTVEKATGRELSVEGGIEPKIGLAPSFRIGKTRLQNAEWGSRPDMVVLKGLEIQIGLLSLLRGKIDIERLVLIEPDILMELDKSGRSNFEFGETAPSSPQETASDNSGLAVPDIGYVEIRDGRFTYRDAKDGTVHLLQAELMSLKHTGRTGTLELAFKGAYGDRRFELSGKTGTLNVLLDKNEPWEADLVLKTPNLEVSAQGTLRDVYDFGGYDLHFVVSGGALSEFPFFSDLPDWISQDLKTSFQMSDPSPRVLKVEQLEAAWDQDDLKGALEIDFSQKPPAMSASLSSKHLDLQPWIDENNRNDKKPEENRNAKPSTGNPEKVFSSRPIDLGVLEATDGVFDIEVGKLLGLFCALDDLSLKADIQSGRLTVDPVVSGIGGGRLEGSFAVASRNKSVETDMTLKIDTLDVGEMLRDMGVESKIDGEIDGTLALRGAGGSVAEILAGANGKAALSMEDGKFEMRELGLLKLELLSAFAELIYPFSKKKDTSIIHCLYAGIDIVEGTAKFNAMIGDFADLVVTGNGEIDLATERLNLSFQTSPKKSILGIGLSAGELTKLVKLSGTLQSPSLGVDPLRSTIVVGKAVGGALIYGPAGLAVGLLKLGSANDNPCASLLQPGQENASAEKEKKSIGQKAAAGVKDAFNGAGSAVKSLFRGR